nr:putative ribonuclease H-like domain-containing protein [Tanacetum cinerariifolium]
MCDKKNSVLFNDTECIVLSPNFKLTDESQVLLRVPRKNNMYSVDLKNIIPKEGLTCHFAKATSDESKLWHRRLGHLKFKTMNKLVTRNLVRGLPSKLFEINQDCVAFQKGKQHRASYKSKNENSIRLPLHLLHMDLFGLTFVKILMKKMYCLVITDDYSRFTSVFFLATKDETSAILKTFITSIENLVDHKVVEGFFVGYSLNIRAFKVFNNRIRIVEENLHIRFSENTPNIAGSGPNWLFDIDALTKSMNYNLVVIGNQSIGNADPRQESKCKDQEKKDNVNNTNNVNVAGTNGVNAVGANTNNELHFDPEMPALEDISTFNFLSDHEDDDEIVDMNKLDTTIQAVIVNGDYVSPVGTEGPISPKTAELKLARKNEVKAKSTLMLAVLDKHLLKFHACKDAKSLWEGIKNRFGGNKNQRICRRPFSSRIMKILQHQEDANMKLLRSLPLAWNNIALIMINKPDLDTLSIDDLYNNLKLDNEDLEKIDTDDIEVLDLKWQVIMLTMRVKRRSHFGRECRAPRNQGNRNRDALTRNAPVDTSTTNALVVQDGIVLPPYTRNYMPLRADLFFAGLDNSVFKSKVSETITSVPKIDTNASKTSKDSLEKPKTVRPSAPLIEERKLDSEDENVFKPKEVKKTVKLVSDDEGNRNNVVKSSACWIWRPKRNLIDHISKDSGSYSLKSFNYVDPQGRLKSDQGIFDSGCSRHMTGNKSYLTDYQEINGGFVAFGGNAKGAKITRKGKIRTRKLDFKDVYFVKELKFNLFSVSQMCDKKNSVLFTNTECVVLSPDFKLLDESKSCLRIMNEFCEMKGIRREFSVARTPQQNGVAKRENKTLIEAAMTMLADSKLPTTFWAEVVNTACYVQNRVLVIKPHNNTPYELLLGRKLALSFMRPFRCPVTILNTLDHLGPKSSEYKVVDDAGNTSTKVQRKENGVQNPAKEGKKMIKKRISDVRIKRLLSTVKVTTAYMVSTAGED